LEEVLQEHMASLDTSESSGAAACIRREIQSSLHADRRFGYLNTNEHWPKPTNAWMEGAVQCAKCVSCDKYFDTDKAIRSHILVRMTTAERENHFRTNASGSWIYTAPSTKWCVVLTLPNPIRSRLVPVSKKIAAARPAATLAVPAPAHAPAVDVRSTFKCCCDTEFDAVASLKRCREGLARLCWNCSRVFHPLLFPSGALVAAVVAKSSPPLCLLYNYLAVAKVRPQIYSSPH
jgi:hypothetical protein